MLRRRASAVRASLVNYQRRDPKYASSRISRTVQTGATTGLRERLVQLSKSRLVRQNAILFSGGPGAGLGGVLFPPPPAAPPPPPPCSPAPPFPPALAGRARPA